MITNEQAIKFLQETVNFLENNKSFYPPKDIFLLAISALEKQIARKPIMKPYFEDMDEEYLCCPTCGEILTDRIPSENKKFYFHCLACGQKFDWEE